MLILVHTAHPQAVEHQGDGFGRLLSPRQFSRAADTAAAGIPWAADNDCFQRLDVDAYTRMLAAIRDVPGCLFVSAPDVVGDWETTLTTEYKLSAEAERVGREAKERGLWLHMGRVNSRKRFDYARAGGRWLGVAAIVLAGAVSWWVSSPTIAVASGGTFLISESFDFLVYTPLQRRWFVSAVVASGVVAAVVNSLIFLRWAGIGYGGGELAGLIVAKLLTVVAVGGPLAYALRRRLPLARGCALPDGVAS